MTMMDVWTGRIDSEEEGFALRWHQVMRTLPATERGTVLLGFACDAGVVRNHGRAGAALGPAVIRKALANIPLAKSQSLWDGGDVVCEGDALETAQADFAAQVRDQIVAGQRVIGLGGGHEIAYASFTGVIDALTQEGKKPRIGIINFDAHFDLRAGARGSSGTPFRQISERCAQAEISFDYLCMGVSRFANTAALFERAEKLGVQWRLDEDMCAERRMDADMQVQQFLDRVDAVYLTICLDVLPPHCAPGVSAPSARGVELAILEPLIDAIARSGKLRMADVAELNPSLDQDSRTARVAARLLARITEQWAG